MFGGGILRSFNLVFSTFPFFILHLSAHKRIINREYKLHADLPDFLELFDANSIREQQLRHTVGSSNGLQPDTHNSIQQLTNNVITYDTQISSTTETVNGFVYYQFYKDSDCASSPAYSTGFITNYCISEADGSSFLISFSSAADCEGLQVSYFVDSACEKFDFSITATTSSTVKSASSRNSLGDFTQCFKADRASLGSYDGHCWKGTASVPVANNVVLVEEKDSDLTCAGETVGFIAYATETCLANKAESTSIQFRCNSQYDGVRKLRYEDSVTCNLDSLWERQMYTTGCSTTRHFTDDTFDDDALILSTAPIIQHVQLDQQLNALQLKKAAMQIGVNKPQRKSVEYLRGQKSDPAQFIRTAEALMESSATFISGGFAISGRESIISNTYEAAESEERSQRRLSDKICDPFTQENTASVTLQYSTCSVFACPGDVLTIGMCDEEALCAGDTYLRLFNSFGAQMFEPSTAEDDACGSCSQFTYAFTDTCQTYAIREGCYGNTICSGTVVVRDVSPASPTLVPTAAPTAPVPTAPSTQIRFCDPFAVSNTNSAQQNFANCTFEACAGQVLTIGTCSAVQGQCSGDTYLRLFDMNGNLLVEDDDSCDNSKCAVISYSFTAECQEYIIHEGCFGDSSCGGTVSISGGLYKATNIPTMKPSTFQPTSFPTITPRFCQSYQASNTGMAQNNVEICHIYACPNTELILSSCKSGGTCAGDQVLRLLSESGNLLALDDDSCGNRGCSEIVYRTTGACQTYQLYQGCFDETSCSGLVSISTTSDALDLTFYETSCVSTPTAAPSTISPSANNLMRFKAVQLISGVDQIEYNADIALHEGVLKSAIARCMSGIDASQVTITKTSFTSSSARRSRRILFDTVDHIQHISSGSKSTQRALQVESLKVKYTVSFRADLLDLTAVESALTTAVTNGQFNIYLETFVEDEAAAGFDGATSTIISISADLDINDDTSSSSANSGDDGDDLFGDVGQTNSILILCAIAVVGACILGLIAHYFAYGTLLCKCIPPLWFQDMFPWFMRLLDCEFTDPDAHPFEHKTGCCTSCLHIVCCCCFEYDSDDGVQEIEVVPSYRRDVGNESMDSSVENSAADFTIPPSPAPGLSFYSLNDGTEFDDDARRTGLALQNDRFRSLYRSGSINSESFDYRRRRPPRSADDAVPVPATANRQYAELRGSSPVNSPIKMDLPLQQDALDANYIYQNSSSAFGGFNNTQYDYDPNDGEQSRPSSPASCASSIVDSLAGSAADSSVTYSMAGSVANSMTSSSLAESSLAGIHVSAPSVNGSVEYSIGSSINRPIPSSSAPSLAAFLALNCRSNDTYVSSDSSSRPMETIAFGRQRTLSSGAVDLVDPDDYVFGEPVSELDPRTVAAAAFAEAQPAASLYASATYAPRNYTQS